MGEGCKAGETHPPTPLTGEDLEKQSERVNSPDSSFFAPVLRIRRFPSCAFSGPRDPRIANAAQRSHLDCPKLAAVSLHSATIPHFVIRFSQQACLHQTD